MSYPRDYDYEGEAISMAYDAYVERQYDEWCAYQEQQYCEELEREHHAWEWRQAYGVEGIIDVIEGQA